MCFCDQNYVYCFSSVDRFSVLGGLRRKVITCEKRTNVRERREQGAHSYSRGGTIEPYERQTVLVYSQEIITTTFIDSRNVHLIKQILRYTDMTCDKPCYLHFDMTC